MLNTLKNLRNLLRDLFGDSVPESVAWDRVPPELMTPRERLIRRSSLIMFWGALINALAGILVIVAAVHAGNVQNELFGTLQAALLSKFTISADAAALLLIAGILANMAILLVPFRGDTGAGTLDGLHRLANDGGQSGGFAGLLASRLRCWLSRPC